MNAIKKSGNEFPLWHSELRIQWCQSYGVNHGCGPNPNPGQGPPKGPPRGQKRTKKKKKSGDMRKRIYFSLGSLWTSLRKWHLHREVKIVSFLAWEEEGMIHSRQREQHMQGPEGEGTIPGRKWKRTNITCNGRKEQQEMWLKRLGVGAQRRFTAHVKCMYFILTEVKPWKHFKQGSDKNLFHSNI